MNYNEASIAVIVSVLLNLTAFAAEKALPEESIPRGIRYQTTTYEEIISRPVVFAENRGQWNNEILFRAVAGGTTIWITRSGQYFQFCRRKDDGKSISSNEERELLSHFSSAPDSAECLLVKATFEGANPHPIVVAENPLEYRCNYFLGKDPSEWRIDVPNYSSLIIKELYPGIDLRYYGNRNQVEYDFIVSPGADPSRIKMNYRGIKSLSMDESGSLLMETSWGVLRQSKPHLFQQVGNTRHELPGEYITHTDNSWGIRYSGVPEPDAPVIIDPILSYSTYLGGADLDEAKSIAVDDQGNAYIAGATNSADFPVKDAYDSIFNISRDVFVTKLASSGSSLVYSTYIGGTAEDNAAFIVLDADGNSYLTGYTESGDFPLVNAYDGIYNGNRDAFVVKLSSAGNSLTYSTYLGGTGQDNGNSIAIDSDGQAYVAGSTWSSDFPTLNPYDNGYNGQYDAFLAKFVADGNSLIYSTFLGGTNTDIAGNIAIDQSGNAYVTGITYSSTDFPLRNAYDGTFNGNIDVFVTKFIPSGNDLAYSTYIGGNSMDASYGIAVVDDGRVYITGAVSSSNFPTVNAYDSTYNGVRDIFVTEISAPGNALDYSTFIGGTGREESHGMAIDKDGNIFLAGYTESLDFPTFNAYDDSCGGIRDAFTVKLAADGKSLVYSTYLGGTGDDNANGIALDTGSNAYVTGITNSTNFPTAYAYDNTYNDGTQDIFIVKFSEKPDYICGDADGNGAVNILDVAFIINYLYKGGPAPVPQQKADVNRSGGVNILDVAYLVSYLYKGGPAPGCP